MCNNGNFILLLWEIEKARLVVDGTLRKFVFDCKSRTTKGLFNFSRIQGSNMIKY